LAVSDDDGAVRLWNVASPRRPTLRSTLPHYTTYVPGVAFSPDGHLLATGGYDNQVRLWSVEAGRPSAVAVLAGRTSDVLAVHFSPDGRLLLAQTYGEAELRDITRLDRPRELGVVRGTEMSFVSNSVVASLTLPAGAQDLKVYGPSQILLTWRVGRNRSPVKLWSLPLLKFYEAFLTVDPAHSKIYVTGFSPKHVRVTVWNAVNPAAPKMMDSRLPEAGSAVITPNGRNIVLGGRTASVWDVSTPTSAVAD
jgi:WD40 repeat protein